MTNSISLSIKYLTDDGPQSVTIDVPADLLVRRGLLTHRDARAARPAAMEATLLSTEIETVYTALGPVPEFATDVLGQRVIAHYDSPLSPDAARLEWASQSWRDRQALSQWHRTRWLAPDDRAKVRRELIDELKQAVADGGLTAVEKMIAQHDREMRPVSTESPGPPAPRQ